MASCRHQLTTWGRRFEFPQLLDMYPYTKEAMDEKDAAEAASSPSSSTQLSCSQPQDPQPPAQEQPGAVQPGQGSQPAPAADVVAGQTASVPEDELTQPAEGSQSQSQPSSAAVAAAVEVAAATVAAAEAAGVPVETPPLVSTAQPNRPDSCVYDLRGIVVHSGTANAGHYYSYIKVSGVC